jgi:hypothetical protein
MPPGIAVMMQRNPIAGTRELGADGESAFVATRALSRRSRRGARFERRRSSSDAEVDVRGSREGVGLLPRVRPPRRR